MDELTLGNVKQRAVKGVAALTGRMFIFQIINRAGEFMLTVFLGGAQYGVFWIVSAVVNFLAYFSDIGLAAALIQKKERVTEEELRVTFTIQQLLVLLILLVLFLAAPFFKVYYDLSQESIWLLYALGISLFLSSLKTIPSVLLERKLEFTKLVIPQIGEVIAFNVIAVYLAWQGYGVTSFTAAVLARGVVGLVLIYILQPWKPGFAFSRSIISGLLKFGLPYQANTFLAVIKDDGMTVFLGGILGASGMGLLGWAQRWAFAPLRFFMDQVIKVTFPAFSRMQDNKEELSRAVSKSILFVCLLVFPSLVGLLLLAPSLTEIIPKYEKWQPALIALSLFSVNAAWAAVTTPLTNLLNAIGKITITFRLMIMWTTLTWVSTPFLAILYGVNGAAAGSAIIGTTSIVAIFIIRRYVTFDLVGSIGKPILASLIMGVVILFLRSILPVSFFGILAISVGGLVVYVSIIFFLVGNSIFTDAKRIFNALRT